MKKKKNHRLWTVKFEGGTILKEGYRYYPCTGKKCFNCWAEKVSVEMDKEYNFKKAKKRGTGI